MYPGKIWGGRGGSGERMGLQPACLCYYHKRGIPRLSAGHKGTCLPLLLKNDWLFKAKIKITVIIRFITYLDIKQVTIPSQTGKRQ